MHVSCNAVSSRNTTDSMCKCACPAKQNLLMIRIRVIFNSLCHGKNCSPFPLRLKYSYLIFGWWTLKDVDYRGNVFPDPTNPGVNTLLSLKVKRNSVSSQLTLRPEPPTQAPKRLSSFGTTGSSMNFIEYMAAPRWFPTHMSSTDTKINCVACQILFKRFEKD